MPASRRIIIIASILLGVAVILGAFGAHALEEMVTPDRLDTWETGVFYHFVHGLALLFVGQQMHADNGRWLSIASYLFIAGIFIFSGSLYLLVITDTGWLGAITPLGGISFILAWFMVATNYYTKKD